MVQFLQKSLSAKNWLLTSSGFYIICSASKSRKLGHTFKSDTKLTPSVAKKADGTDGKLKQAHPF